MLNIKTILILSLGLITAADHTPFHKPGTTGYYVRKPTYNYGTTVTGFKKPVTTTTVVDEEMVFQNPKKVYMRDPYEVQYVKKPTLIEEEVIVEEPVYMNTGSVVHETTMEETVRPVHINYQQHRVKTPVLVESVHTGAEAPVVVEMSQEQRPVEVQLVKKEKPIMVELLKKEKPIHLKVTKEEKAVRFQVIREDKPGRFQVVQEEYPIKVFMLREDEVGLGDTHLFTPTSGSSTVNVHTEVTRPVYSGIATAEVVEEVVNPVFKTVNAVRAIEPETTATVMKKEEISKQGVREGHSLFGPTIVDEVIVEDVYHPSYPSYGPSFSMPYGGYGYGSYPGYGPGFGSMTFSSGPFGFRRRGFPGMRRSMNMQKKKE